MQLVLEIKNERDLAILLPLLERLNISFSQTADKPKLPQKAAGKKNFDIEHLEHLFDELEAMNAFAVVENPTEWQKQLRDEWN
ncbi:MAG: hypothetical protein H6574_16525 [Lewinellaceae bacterium]|nr:hypothetical protein [Saprospiraceae bacterium]MCB9332678.1 hypothetical protein [Lewinellaceae bacterium]